MVISEALVEIKDLERKRREVQQQLDTNIYILPDLDENETPPSMEESLSEYVTITERIAFLKTSIIKKNVETTISLPDGKQLSLMETIKAIETFRTYTNLYANCASRMGAKESKFFQNYRSMSDSSIKLESNFLSSVKGVQAKAEEYRELARKYEQALIKANWQTEI